MRALLTEVLTSLFADGGRTTKHEDSQRWRSSVVRHTTLALAATAVALAPMPRYARQLVLTRPGQWLAARRFLRRRGRRLVWMHMWLCARRLIGPVRRVTARRD